jgi:hypothetical protein
MLFKVMTRQVRPYYFRGLKVRALTPSFLMDLDWIWITELASLESTPIVTSTLEIVRVPLNWQEGGI